MKPFSEGAPTQEQPLRRVLVVDDETRILDFVSRGLRREGFAVDIAADGKTGLERSLNERYDLVILDLLMPGLDGVSVLRGILARKPDLPVMVLSALSDIRSKVETADELLYPGTPEGELRVRLAMLRRRLGGGQEASIRLGACAINSDTYQVTCDGRPLDLTYKEFELLKFLAQHPGRVFTRSALLREVWGYDFYGGTRTVDVHIRRLRAKLGPAVIVTVRGEGYRVDGR